MVAAYALAIAITLLVQVPVVAAFYPRQRGRMAAVCAVATVATNLGVDALFLRGATGYGASVVAAELVTTALEAIAYTFAASPRDPRRAFAASAAANMLSYAIGLLVR